MASRRVSLEPRFSMVAIEVAGNEVAEIRFIEDII
jgi:hypothetical protein